MILQHDTPVGPAVVFQNNYCMLAITPAPHHTLHTNLTIIYIIMKLFQNALQVYYLVKSLK